MAAAAPCDRAGGRGRAAARSGSRGRTPPTGTPGFDCGVVPIVLSRDQRRTRSCGGAARGPAEARRSPAIRARGTMPHGPSRRPRARKGRIAFACPELAETVRLGLQHRQARGQVGLDEVGIRAEVDGARARRASCRPATPSAARRMADHLHDHVAPGVRHRGSVAQRVDAARDAVKRQREHPVPADGNCVEWVYSQPALLNSPRR